MAGVDIVHVPYREANSALSAVVSGAVEMMFSIASTAQSQVAGGTVRVSRHDARADARSFPACPRSRGRGCRFRGHRLERLHRSSEHAGPDRRQVEFGAAARARRRRVAQSAWKRPDTSWRPTTRRRILARFIAADTERWSRIVEKVNIRVK